MANEKNSAEFHGKHHVKSDKDGNMLIQDENHKMVAVAVDGKVYRRQGK